MTEPLGPELLHTSRLEVLGREAARLDRSVDRLSLVRLVAFLGAAAAGFTAVSQGSPGFSLLSLLLFAVFFAAVIAHARVYRAKRVVDERRGVHLRALQRLSGEWTSFANDGAALLDGTHPYARDIDLVGPGSLFQRIDVTQTCAGERALASTLAAPLARSRIAPRQAAVAELAERHAFREELEVLPRLAQERGKKLDHAPFMALLRMPSVFAARPWLRPLMFVSVGITAAAIVLAQLDLVPSVIIWMPVLAQGALLWKLKEPVHASLNLVTARLGFAEAYRGMFELIEREPWRAPNLVDLRRSLDVSGRSPSAHMARLARYEGYSQLRTQGPLYLVLNVLTLWDLFCLERIETLVREIGAETEHWFDVVSELEVLSSLASFRHGDPSATFPAIVDAEQGFSAQAIAHPLLSPQKRVSNDVAIDGPGSLVVVTGSNMAGKSTLLRAVGLNVALALAGGPVCARSLSVPSVRLRASMRVDDSLQRGASYFHAELTKLRMVVRELDEGPPVLFLLDELLRGTNAKARHAGARAVIVHLLERGAMGFVATHDIALSSLETDLARVHNVHFTDVFEEGEMRFDYKLRDGVVKTSNALRLLAMAGIEVAVDDTVA